MKRIVNRLNIYFMQSQQHFCFVNLTLWPLISKILIQLVTVMVKKLRCIYKYAITINIANMSLYGSVLALQILFIS